VQKVWHTLYFTLNNYIYKRLNTWDESLLLLR